MTTSINIGREVYNRLSARPEGSVNDRYQNIGYSAKFVIPNYRQKIEDYYSDIIQGSLAKECETSGIYMPFEHFGIAIKFEKPTEVSLYNGELRIHDGLCDLISSAGPIILQNVYLETAVRDYGHRNRFPHLQFHIDRSAKQEARHSMYTRDPFDAEQKHPRTSSTLFITNIVAHLQALKEGTVTRESAEEIITTRLIFEKEDMEKAIGNVILEQAWTQPEGTGEICIIDNISVLHASYYRDAQRSGYKIGVRYLSGTSTAYTP